MSQQAWVCSLCKKSTAVFFCYCDSTETFLCDVCLGKHYMKTPGRLHQCVPVAAYGQHTVQGYFERLTVRSNNFAKRQADALENLNVVDRCIAEFSTKVDSMIDALNAHRTVTVQKLQAVRRSLETDIQRAVQEAEDAMYFDTVQDSNYLLEMMRRTETAADEMSLFRYTVSAEAFPSINSVVAYEVGQTRGLSVNLRFPVVSSTSFAFVCQNGGVSNRLTLPVSFDQNTRVVYTGQYVFFLPWGQSYRLDNGTGELVSSPRMLKNRSSFGVFYQGGVIFAFGGRDQDSPNELKECEKFNVAGNIWTNLPQMHAGRSNLTLAKLSDDLYLLTSSGCERFSLTTETFTKLSFCLPHGSSVAFFIDDELTVLSLSDCNRYKRRPTAGETTFRMSKFSAPGSDDRWKIGPVMCPVVEGRTVLWVVPGNQKLMKYLIDSNAIA